MFESCLGLGYKILRGRESSLGDDKVKMGLGFIVRLRHHERALVTFNELVLNTTSAVSGIKFSQSRDLLLCLSRQKFCQALPGLSGGDLIQGDAKEQNIAFIRPRVFPNKQQNECPEETYLRIALVKIFRCIFALFEFTSCTV